MAYNPLAFGLMLTATASLVFAVYLLRKIKGVAKDEDKGFGAVFMLLASIAGIFGFSIYFQETLPAQYIEVYAVGYLVLAMMFGMSGLTIFNNWNKKPAATLGAMAGVILIHSGYVIMTYNLSKSPLAAAATFCLAGFGSLFTSLAVFKGDKKVPQGLVYLAILALVVSGLLALYTGMNAQGGHVSGALAAAAKAAAEAAAAAK